MTNFDFLLSEPQFASFAGADAADCVVKTPFGDVLPGGLRGELSPGDGVCRKMDVLGGFGAGQTL